jgi:hypothetical protein
MGKGGNLSHQNSGKYGKNTAKFHRFLLPAIANAISMPSWHPLGQPCSCGWVQAQALGGAK